MPFWLVFLLLTAAAFILGSLILRRFGIPLPRLVAGQGPAASLLFPVALGVACIGWPALLLAELGLFSLPLLIALWLVSAVALWLGGRRPAAESTTSSDQSPDRAGRSTRSEDRQPPFPDSKTAEQRFWALPLPPFLESICLILWLAAAAWLFFRPHEFIIGGADAGVYVNLAASINDQGSLVFNDPALAELDPALYPALLRSLPASGAGLIAPYYILPGFYVPGTAGGEVIPQFFPLHPLWQALAYALGGVTAALALNGLWALLGSLAVYQVVRQIAGWQIALLALAGLSLNALQLWFARYPTTELLTQFLLWTSLWALMRWLQALNKDEHSVIDEQEAHPWALLAGLTLGQVFLTRIDTYFLLAIPAMIWLLLYWSGRLRRKHSWLFLPLAAVTAHSLIHAFWQSLPYTYDLVAYGLLLVDRLWYLALPLLLLAAGLLVVGSRSWPWLQQLTRYRRPLLLTTIALLAALALYGWFIRPYLGGGLTVREEWFGGGQIPSNLNRENLIRLGWYLSPQGIALAVAGVGLLLWRLNRQTAVVLAAGLMFALLYLWRIQANPHQIYAMRRYVPAVMPLAIIAAAYLLGSLLQKAWPDGKATGPRQWAAGLAVLLLAGLWLAGLGWSARGFVSQVDYRGITEQLAAVDEQLPAHSVLIFYDEAAVTLGDQLGTPLHFLFGHDVFSLRQVEALDAAAWQETVAGWQAAGRAVYWVGDPAPLASWGLTAGETTTFTLQAQALEGSYEHKPTVVWDLEWTLVMTQVEGGG